MAGLSTSAKVIKFVIVACNILSLLFGLAIIILGILDLVHFESIIEADILTISTAVATAAIVLGLFITLVAFLGLFGALQANSNVLIAIPQIIKKAFRAAAKEGKAKYMSSQKWPAIIDWVEAKDCAEVIAEAVEAELVTIGGCLIGLTLLSFLASALAFVLAHKIKGYEKV
ncbi:unnamed protein product [Schistocephalus solidus]|uniref:Uncharacterized protein n=1 Tax=Schistocephalus solidus TaxID=70667 RepID=A0A183SAS0_SCHSO|nr:unnamed protein product [Schistocephalus solidus]